MDMATEKALEVINKSEYELCDFCGTMIENKVGCHYTCQCGYQTGCGD